MSNTTQKELYPSQCRAARALLDIKQTDLAASLNMSRKTLHDFENNKRTPQPRTIQDIKQAFEKRGMVFVNDGEFVGVKVAFNNEGAV